MLTWNDMEPFDVDMETLGPRTDPFKMVLPAKKLVDV